MKMYRLVSILLKLENGKMMTAGELAGELEVSKRTILRDIAELCESGVPIVSIEGKNGGYYIDKDAAYRFSTLFQNEVENVLLSVMGISSKEQRESAGKSIYPKLGNIFSPQYGELTRIIEKRFVYDDEAWWNTKNEIDYKPIVHAILSANKLKLYDYRPNSSQGQMLNQRTVCPYGVVVKNNEWYLVGFCESRNEMRTFKCSRIKKFDVLPSSFKIPDDFNLKEYWGKRVDEYKAEIVSSLVYPVTIRVINEGFEMPLSNLPVRTGHNTYAVKYKSFEDAVKEIRLMLDNVIVVEPQELKGYFMHIYSRLLDIYEGTR